MAAVPESQQAAAVRRKLVEMVRAQGPGLLDDGRRVRAMLADAVAGATAEANLVALAIASGVPSLLRDGAGDPGSVDAAAQDLQRTSSVQAADARWAVESIAEAMGLTTGQRAAPAVPRDGPVAGAGGSPGPHDLVVRVAGKQHVAAPGSVVTVGRDPECTITLDSPAVSRLHGRILRGPDGWEFRDEGSTQGSFVNGVAVGQVALQDETEVTLGQGREAVALRLVPFGEARTHAPQRPRPAQATELPGARPGGALAAGGAPPTQLGGTDSGATITVSFAGADRTLRPGDTATIGREDDNDLVARHTTVSRHHARIRHEGGDWRLEDLGSTSGTWLGSKRITAPVTLSGRQEFVLGDRSDGDQLVTQPSGATRAPDGRSGGGRLGGRATRVAVAAALAVVLGAGGLLTWQVLADDGSKGSTTKGTEQTDGTVSADDLARATVRLVNEEGSRRGSGVVIDRDNGLVLTNAHVAAPSAPGLGVFLTEFADERPDNPERLRIDVSDGLDESAEPRFYGEVVAVDGYLDVAVVRIVSKLSGAPTDEDDLAALVEAPLGDSDGLGTSDDVSFYGYPVAAGSAAPTFTRGVVAGPVQDDRLDEFRAVINTDAAISSGNSGGPAVDESGKVVGIATWETFDEGGTAFSRIRPINLARPVIDAAVADERYRSPWSKPGPRSAEIPFWDYGVPEEVGAVTAGCVEGAAGASPTTFTMEYEGFPRGRHTDVAAALDVPIEGGYRRVAVSTSDYPTRLPPKGCMTLTFDTDVPPGTYRLKVGVGGDLRVVVDASDFTIE